MCDKLTFAAYTWMRTKDKDNLLRTADLRSAVEALTARSSRSSLPRHDRPSFLRVRLENIRKGTVVTEVLPAFSDR